MKTQRYASPWAIVAVGILCAPTTGLSAQLPRYGLPTRVENHMLPAVSTGPMDPAWSPDGQWIAFSMRGDIWKVPSEGGEAVALTQGPAYYFEPAWSPDGQRLAVSVEIGGDFDIAIIGAEGGEVNRITTGTSVDIQPAWSPDGQVIYYASARSGNFDIVRINTDGSGATPVATERGNQFQPSAAPSGDRIAYVSPVPGRLGSGGIWARDFEMAEPALTHYEETSYRPVPVWTPDGGAFVYASDVAGNYDISVVPAHGGNVVRLTHEPSDEFAPTISPDGTRIAFVSNATGPTQLFTMPSGGGSRSSWRRVPIPSLRHSRPIGTLNIEVIGPDGRPTPARVRLVASDGRAYSPNGGFHRVSPANEIHYFHTDGTSRVDVPAGTATVEVTRGFEYQPLIGSIDVLADENHDLTMHLQHTINAPAAGWFSGDTHVHDLHEGRFGLTQREFFMQHVADDLHVANALIHMDGTKIMGRWDDLTGRDHPLSDASYILRYAQEFRGSYGHVGLLGVKTFITPLIAGTAGSPYAEDLLKVRYLDGVVADGGIGGFMHPYNGNVSDVRVAAQSDIPIHVALGKGQFFDIVSVASDELSSAAMYYRMLNSGFRLSATGGTDNFGNVWRDPSGGTARTYAHLDRPLSWDTWIDAVRRGRTFATNGPLLFARVNDSLPGSELFVSQNDPTSFAIDADIQSNTPVDRLEVIVNGSIVRTMRPDTNPRSFHYADRIELDTSGWIAVRLIGDRDRYVDDNYAFAHTTPVYITRGDRTFTRDEDAQFLLNVIDEIWSRVERRDAWQSETAKDEYRSQIDAARRAYQAAITSGSVN